ncbi:alanine--tRNA ligase [Myxococcota bacterium]|nr:alanine--tRNA ligase [Myxococcota bacterium]
MTTASQIRQLYLDFFAKRGHRVVPSAPVFPQDDPTLLFTNAGMNQFKDVFLGTGSRPYSRAADTQKCIRVSGKHNDLEEVGIDTYHHTFFEMLGNWSFGDYFKTEAIEWAWEFLTDVAKLPVDRLYVTVFEGNESVERDQESAEIWQTRVKVPDGHLHYCGAKDNFWEMGDSGPCGPCTEIHVDRGPAACDRQGVPGHVCRVNGDCARYMEVWNLVFIQYNRMPDGHLEPLPARHVDTGMGFERLVGLWNGKLSNYDTDLFSPLFDHLTTLCGITYGAELKTDIAFRVIADHARTLCMAITDGVTPSNTGRGYVLRRLLRRAVRYGRQFLGLSEPFLGQLAPTVAGIYPDIFPEIGQRLAHVQAVLTSEETSFGRTIEQGIRRFDELASELASGTMVIDGGRAFQLYATYGFPQDLIELMARERGLRVDEAGWSAAQADHEKASEGKKRVYTTLSLDELEGVPATTFVGYPHDDDAESYGTRCEAAPLALVNGDTVLVLDRSPFYAESGGQIGDTGRVSGEGFLFEVLATRKFGDYILHEGKLTEGTSTTLPAKVVAQVDLDRRIDTMANHTATHLLHYALHHVLGDHAQQQGSSVDPGRLRFDFTHPTRVTPEELAGIERIVNERILENAPVRINVMDLEEARASGATAIFGEKYGESVRVVSAGDFSRELCGGTHVISTGQIGSFAILEESALSAGVRRIVAVTRHGALAHFQGLRGTLLDTGRLLKVPADQVPGRVEKLLAQLEELRAGQAKKATADVKDLRDQLWSQAHGVGDVHVIVAYFAQLDREGAARLADELRSDARRCAGLLVVPDKDDGLALLTFASAGIPAVHAGIPAVHAGNLLKELAALVGGRGGGRADFAQGGGRDPEKIPMLLETAKNRLISLLS